MKPKNDIVKHSTTSTSTDNLLTSNRNGSITNFLHENQNCQISDRSKDQVDDEELEKASRMKKIEEIRSNLFAKQRANSIGVEVKPTRDYLYRMEKIKDKGVACESSEFKVVESRATLYRKNKIKDTGMLTEGLQLGRTKGILEKVTNEYDEINTIANKMVQAKGEDFIMQGKIALSPARTISKNFSLREKYPEYLNKKNGRISANVGVNCDLYINKNTYNRNSQSSCKSRLYEENSIDECIEDNTTTYRRKSNRSPIRRFTGTKSARLKFDYTQSQISKPQVEEFGGNKKVCNKSGSDIINKKSFFERNSQYYPSYHYYGSQ